MTESPVAPAIEKPRDHPPATPTNLSIKHITHETATVGWKHSVTGTSPVHYIVQWRPHIKDAK